jgi:hypothetical protein
MPEKVISSGTADSPAGAWRHRRSLSAVRARVIDGTNSSNIITSGNGKAT